MEVHVNLPEISLCSEDRMTSVQISIIIGKPHNDVLKAIRKMEAAWEKVNEGKFSLVDYTDSKGEKRPCYSLTKTECLYIATKFNDEARAKLVLRWEELEKQKREIFKVPQSFREALLLAAEQQGKIEEQQKAIEQKDFIISEMDHEIEEMKPKVSYYDTILNCKSTMTVNSIAQDYGYSAMKFNLLLSDKDIQYKQGTQWILYSKYKDCGYVQSKPFAFTRNNGLTDVKITTEWTQKGRLFLYNTLKGYGILPMIER